MLMIYMGTTKDGRLRYFYCGILGDVEWFMQLNDEMKGILL